MSAELATQKRIINVSNRLPVKITTSNGKTAFQKSEGGLATGLSSVFAECKNVWIGWPGAVVKEADQPKVIQELNRQCLSPIFLNAEEIHNYYEGFSNETLWPLFHYFLTYSKYNEEHWESYVAVNTKFANEIIKLAVPGDIIWVHDYQLMLVPQMVREALPDVTIGYFQHIPFPDYEIFRALPWKEQIIKGLLGADTVGFQTEDDTKHFLSTAARILNITAEDGQIAINNRTVAVDAFPISIDYQQFRDLAIHAETDLNVEAINKTVKGKMALSIDRLDYSKGILQRLHAYELFLKQHPEWHERITLVHLVVPSRDTVGSYKDLKEEMNKLITAINGKYATIGWQPIQHFYRSFAPNMLSALYKRADLALVTPLRDGMNLVSKEYVASKVDMNGVLVLSEAAGAARELTDALIINPNDTHTFADKIYEGLTMEEDEKMSRMARMQEQVRNADVFFWADSFIKKLRNSISKKPLTVCVPVGNKISREMNRRYISSRKRLLLLDYDGTLVPFCKRPADASPDAELLQVLQKLAADKRNTLVVISGRDKDTLESWLGHLNIDMVGEHGAWFKEDGRQWQSAAGLDSSWKGNVQEIFDFYSLITPNSSSEEKAYSIAWHYRAADAVQGEQHALGLLGELKDKLKNQGLDIIHGSKVIEVKSNKVSKGKATLQLLDNDNYDFIMAVGDDKTDEDMFKVLPENTFSIKVGSNITAAAYWHESYTDVRNMLKSFAGVEAPMVGKVMQLLVNKAS